MVQKHPQNSLSKLVFAKLFLVTLMLVLLVLVGCVSVVLAQDQENSQKAIQTEEDVEGVTRLAPVEIDGKVLFSVPGATGFPAEERAASIAGRIRAVASDAAISPADVRSVEVEHGIGVFAANQRLIIIFDVDARTASMPPKLLADIYAERIRNTIVEYRQARSRSSLLRSAGVGLAATALLVVLVLLIIWLSRRLRRALQRFYERRIHSVGIQSFEVVRAEQILKGLQGVINIGRAAIILVVFYVHLQYVLAQFPWTRATAQQLRGYLLGPLEILGRGLLRHIPSIIFLVILYFITKFAIRLIHKFFDALKSGDVKLSGFDPEWADSTYKLIRLGAIALALVIAYPYIPGGNSEAFKGISIFIGVLFSLGSSSAIANLIAGYLLTYRRAFRVGDRVKIGDATGDVTLMRLQATHLKTVKNEEVTIPNSAILNNEVINYSTLARERGLILHTTVGIGYETPWRQVEAMLLMAADRTEGIMKEPRPFVLQKALGDFAVTYEINVYCDNAQAMTKIYTSLHQHILDLFNEYGVQIMTPAYEGDPELPKVVPKEQWFNAPASVTEP